MKLLLDMYKGVSKDQRDKVQLMATEKKLRSEIEEMRNQMKKIQVNYTYHGMWLLSLISDAYLFGINYV